MTGSLSIIASALSQDVRVAVTRAREEGFGGMMFDAFSASLSFPDLSGSGLREVRNLLSSQRQTLVGLRVDLGIKGFGPGADVDRALHQLSRTLDAGRQLAAMCVLVDLGPLPVPAYDSASKPAATATQAGLILLPDPAPAPVAGRREPPDPAFVASVDAALAEFGQIADRFSLPIALGSSLSSFSALDRAIQAARCPWFGIDLDPVAMLRDDWDTDSIFSRLGPLIRHVRAHDAAAGTEKRTKPMPIGRGDVNWNELNSTLRETDYHGWITIDPTELPDRLASARSALKYLSGI